MPKHRRDRSRSLDRFRSSPYASSSKSTRLGSSKASPETAENVKEWEDARCPVCMEHPHNAILIICSSHDKGCRPYMCDTSYRHSNCFDQFRKSFEQTSATVMPDENSDIITTEPVSNTDGTVQEQATLEGIASCDNKVQPQLLCPLCRGDIRTWVVLEPARDFMNAKSRSCAREMCDFSGTYADLRKHARHEHPLVRPSEADPERERNWRRLEQERDLGDLLSTLQSSFGEERGDDASGWLTVIFFIRILRPGSGPRSSTRSGTSRTRTQLLSFRRRSTRVLRENRNEEEDAEEEEEEEEEEETASSSRDGENDTSDGDAAIPLRRSERLRQRRTPDSS
ncbi:hypothetical protein LINGRAHAP2_LOCUS20747 [Linum grandiflorum]